MPVYLQQFNKARLAQAQCLKIGAMVLLHTFLKLDLTLTPQIIVESVFLVVLENYFAQFSIKDSSNTFSRITFFINHKLAF